ncbi:MAG: hypothetical protein HY770_05370 [Chitinivibrionia bacterium]|nr:hypothetical protein [Chitinivibrionia bacterium]
MIKTHRRMHVIMAFSLLAAFTPRPAVADPCLLAYPDMNAVFQFNPSNYLMIFPGDSLYDPDYDRFGVMLWDIRSDRIAYELYQAPGLLGFEPALAGANSFNLPANKFTLYIDGFYHAPRQLNDVYVRFLPTPFDAEPAIYVDGERITGLYYYIPQLVVSTRQENGFYSDTIALDIAWSGAESMKITVFSDKDGNRVFDGEALYNVFMMDQTVPAESATWGQIKAQFE